MNKENEQPSKQKLISIADLVKRWGCSRHFIWEKCKSGDIPANKIGERWLINLSWVEEYEDNMIGDSNQSESTDR